MMKKPIKRATVRAPTKYSSADVLNLVSWSPRARELKLLRRNNADTTNRAHAAPKARSDKLITANRLGVSTAV